MTVSLDELPITAAYPWARLCDEAREILGSNLTGLWGYGGTLFPDRSRRLGDLDTCGILERVPDARTMRTLEQAQTGIAREHRIQWDVWYVLAEDAGRSEPPQDVLTPGHRLMSWAIDRAHWLAGWYVDLFGRRPEDTVLAPTRPQIEAALGRELEHLEWHVEEGDDEPFEATYAISNGSRILHAIETGNVAISKRAGGMWALENLPSAWHDAIRAANRAYDGEATPQDAEVLRATMAPFVAMVRNRFRLIEPPPPG